MGLYCHRFLRFSTHSRGLNCDPWHGQARAAAQKDSIPSFVWDNAASTKKIPKRYICIERDPRVGWVSRYMNIPRWSAFIFSRARYYCVSECARVTHASGVCQWTSLSFGSMNDRPLWAAYVEKRTALTFSKCTPVDIF